MLICNFCGSRNERRGDFPIAQKEGSTTEGERVGMGMGMNGGSRSAAAAWLLDNPTTPTTHTPFHFPLFSIDGPISFHSFIHIF
jgi:hypothetical protein